jgi:hypothetical protein
LVARATARFARLPVAPCARFLEFVQDLIDVQLTLSNFFRMLGVAHAIHRFDRIVYP